MVYRWYLFTLRKIQWLELLVVVIQSCQSLLTNTTLCSLKPRKIVVSPLERPRTTVCLLNWKRPENIRAVIRSVSSQLPRPEVFLWNNGADIECEEVDWYVRSSLNKRCWPRWSMARHAETEF